MANSPFTWNPTNTNAAGVGSDILGTPIPGGAVDAGDWCQVFDNYRSTNTQPVAFAAGHFLIHVIYTPDTDDAVPHEDMPTTYGGPQHNANNLGANRRRNYHIDTNVAFQAPWKGQLSVIAGDVSDPSVQVDILLARGHAPRDALAQFRIRDEAEQRAASAIANESQLEMNQAEFLMRLAGCAPRKWAPPVIGVPQLVPATWINIAANVAPAVPFTDGAVKMSVVPAAFAITRIALGGILGNATNLDLSPGIPVDIGTFTGGFACTSGVRPTWSPASALTIATIWSSLGG